MHVKITTSGPRRYVQLVESFRDDEGRILRDNVYGSIDEDVWRRDFTCNALYYNIADFSIIDYVGGYEDIANKRLRLIGDQQTRRGKARWADLGGEPGRKWFCLYLHAPCPPGSGIGTDRG